MKDDLIKRQDAIDAIHKSTEKYNYFMGMENYTDEDAIEAINTVPASQVISDVEWIPVSERLPEKETEVLVCSDTGNMEVCGGSMSTEMPGEWIWYTSGWRFGEVVAWMPLPKPYKENKEMIHG